MNEPKSGYQQYSDAPPPVVTPAVALTEGEQAEVDALYEELKPQATEAARGFVLNRTPVKYQEAMVMKIDADWPLPPVEDPPVS